MANVDDVVVAELPPDPQSVSDPRKRRQLEILQDLIVKNMKHSKCGPQNPNAMCMENNKCSKGYPKPFCSATSIDPRGTNPQYRRLSPAEGGRVLIDSNTGEEITNRDIVPYNPLLLLRYKCHINVEICTSERAAKYLYKYVTKGGDRAMTSTEIRQDGITLDEIKEYADLRSIGPVEAAWHLFSFPIAYHYPPVQAMRVHLEDEQSLSSRRDKFRKAWRGVARLS